MSNRGVEVDLSGTIMNDNDFTFSAGVMFSYNKNEVDYVRIDAPAYYIMLEYPESYPRIGNPHCSIYGYKWAGLSEKGLPQIYTSNGEITQRVPTDLESIVYLGSYIPTCFGSLTLNFRYKNWKLSALFNYEGGHKIRDTFYPYPNGDNSTSGPEYCGILNDRFVNRWKKPGDELKTDIPKMLSTEDPDYNFDSFTIYKYADVNVLDATNIKLRNISLSYELSKDICNRIGIEGCKIQLIGENLFTYAKSKEAKYMLGGYNAAIYSIGLQLNL